MGLDAVTGVILAAGASRRAGTSKGMVRIGGRRLVDWAADTLTRGGCESVFVVVGPPHGRALTEALGPSVRTLVNHEPERGMLSSLQIALDALQGSMPVVVSLLDHPCVRPSTVSMLIWTWHEGRADLVKPVYDDRGGHPIVLGEEAVARVRRAAPSAHTGEVLGQVARIERTRVADPFILQDLDTAAALTRAARRAHGRGSCAEPPAVPTLRLRQRNHLRPVRAMIPR